MYCAACDRWEHDQIAVEDCICLRCYGPLVDPDEESENAADAMLAARTSTRKDERE